MEFQLSEIFDLEKLRELMESFYKVSGVSSGLVDLEGNILIQTGWRDVCIEFHRQGALSKVFCKESDRKILSGIDIENKGQYQVHKCKNGLYFTASPIRIRGIHIGNFMFGQFFLETPSSEEFRQRAQQYGFEEEVYLAAVERVPVYDLEKLDGIIHHFQNFSHVLGEMRLSQLDLIETKKRDVMQAKNQLKLVFDYITNIPVQIYNLEGKILYWNPASEDLFGWKSSEALGKTLDKLIFNKKTNQEFIETLIKIEQGQSERPREWICKDREGNEKTLYSTIVPIFVENKKEFVRIDIDITERKRFEKEFARLDRLNLVGEMAASISHEVRNPMTTVRGFLQVLSEKQETLAYRDYYDLMIQELDRANSIITEFLSLAKNKPIRRKKVSLNQIILALKPLIEANSLIFNQNIEITTKRTPKLRLDEKEIRQLILNLTRNAMEAMDPGGHLVIETYCEEHYVVLCVRDDGPGIDPHVLEKIGTPFITTKPSGTGLGLAVCYSIALRHEAIIEVDTGMDGTTFLIKFKRP